MNKKIIMLAGEGISTNFIFNSLKDNFNISTVIIEENENMKKFLKRRIKRLGYFKVIGQAVFQLIIPRLLRKLSKQRIDEIKRNYKLDNKSIPNSVIKKFISVNSPECIAFIKKEKPDLIIVNGTRIISKKVLNATDATFINTHVGITPKYRGVHGGYWALVNNDKKNCGVTVHLVDSGIDTGGVLFQQKITTTESDNFSTYPFLQTGEGILLMKQAVANFMNDKLKEVPSKTLESKLYYHPTIWFYLYKRVINGVK
ncbi:formyl transferase [Winogradskyella vincentii]|uniref:phosphoribosylglycinamide formyltransferase 1 n=1 Tax=Winogradskyella vincentii TaxID=2877122 RepID=A0ABS7Y0X5_9FLAO|nr:formyl transferase [Winogradskyella vincentii]MCA0152990.1 formyl transferase [Winogradskyella vincentii]